MMRIGFSRKDITPPPGTPMSGQPFKVVSVGIEDPLYARALCLDDGATQVLLVSCDLLLIPNDLSQRLRNAIARRVEIPPENIVCCATHTHSGPGIVQILGSDTDLNYIGRIEKSIIAVAERAYLDRADGGLFVGTGRIEGLAFNRRFYMNDATVETHPLKGDPHIVAPEGPDSSAIGILYAVDSDGAPRGAVTCFGCHATGMERLNEAIGSDYPGAVCREVSAALGGAESLFLQGAAGNICQVDPRNIERREIGRVWVEEMGRRLSGKALDVIQGLSNQTRGALRVSTRRIRIPRRGTDPMLLEWAHGHTPSGAELPHLSDYGIEGYGTTSYPLVSLEEMFKTPYWADFYAQEIVRLEEARKEDPTIELHITVIAQDDWAIVALPCELFVEWSEEIYRNSPFDHTIVVTLANGWCGYVPTTKAFERPGGYETKEVTSTMLIPEAGEILLEEVLHTLGEAKG